jgi:predicted acyl esterase
MDDFQIVNAGGEKIAVRKDLRVPMRDGVQLAADAYQGTEEKPRPALVALSPYGKELQALALTTPPQRRPSPMWDGCIEAGDIARIVKEDYVHVIGDLRGSGHSGGEHIGNYNAGGVSLGQDAYDFIEWVAAQPWCDGNVGMVGISYFGSMQVLAAAERPPHLKAIFVSGGHYDFYETTYHGGVMWFMPRAAREGRGGDSGWAFTDGVKSRMIEKYSWTMDGTLELFNQLKCPKKLDIGPYPPMQSRPFIEEHDKMFRWYDYWIKGIDNGIMEEPAVSVFVEGSREVVTADQWPPKNTKYTSLYLRPRHKLSTEPELMGAEYAAPDGFYQAPLTVTDKVEILSWSTPVFEQDTEMIGTGAAHIFAEIDQPDTNFILRLWDYAPDGKRQLITSGYLKASHRELDERTTEGSPHHPHTRAVPVEPGQIEEYVLRLYPFANTFRPGHHLTVELSNSEPLADEHNALLPPDAFHLPVGRPVTHKIYRDAAHQSRLVLPFTTRAVEGPAG